MNILITGGAGFLGRRLADALLARGVLTGPGGAPEAISRLTLLDITSGPPIHDPRIRTVVGDISDERLSNELVDGGTACIFHLAAIVSAMVEAEFDLGMRINVDATRLLLEACRQAGHRPRVVFASSVAVFGGRLPDTVHDDTAVNPQSSYGTQKAIGELLCNDYTRKGFIDGRVLRLPTISVRPGRPNAAASSFASGIVREPLNGEASVCPVEPGTRIWVMSPATALACFVRGHELPADALADSRTVNLPGISVTAGEMVTSLARVAGPEVAQRVRWELDPRIARIVASWPGAWDTTRARALGFPADESFDEIIRSYMAEAAVRRT